MGLLSWTPRSPVAFAGVCEPGAREEGADSPWCSAHSTAVGERSLQDDGRRIRRGCETRVSSLRAHQGARWWGWDERGEERKIYEFTFIYETKVAKVCQLRTQYLLYLSVARTWR